MTLHEFIAMQMHEIDRHKWIESQKAGHDLGEEAVFDWVMNYADDFRRYIENVLGETVVYTTRKVNPTADVANIRQEQPIAEKP